VPSADAEAPIWPDHSGMDDGRPGETSEQRADRNFGEILQELRVAQTGVQLLFGFLLTVPFQAHFTRTDEWQRTLVVVALMLAALSSAFLIGPVSYHRLLFRRRMKDEVVKAANRLAKLGLACLALAIVTSVLLVLDVVVGRLRGSLLASVILIVLALVWYVLPWWERRAEMAEQRDEAREQHVRAEAPDADRS
jgi:hypothetical protein